MKDHVIICGFGTIGFRTFQLLNSTQHKIVAISATAHEEGRWQVEASGGVFLLGDARDDDLLKKAGIKSAKAILILTEQDMVNVTIAIDARRLNPDIRIIMRLIDNKLGMHIKNELGIHAIFSTSDLAAPIFASSIYDNLSIAQFKANGRHYLVSQESKKNSRMTPHSFVLNEFSSDVSGSKEPVRLVAHLAEGYMKKKPKFSVVISKINYLLSPIFANFRRFLLIVLCVILTAALFLHWAMPMSYIDALYFVTTTVTTVGYGDYNFLNTSAPLKLFGCLLMLSGAAALAMLFSSITEIMLTRKLPSILGGRPVPKRDHVIIIGSGPVGQELVSTLINDEIPVVIIEGGVRDHYAQDVNRKVALVEGYLRSKDTLHRANITSAKAIVVITDDDVENLSISLVAKKLNPNMTNIIHVGSPILGEKLKSSLSLDTVLCLSKIAAPYFAAAVLSDKILVAVEWGNQLIYLSQCAADSMTEGEKITHKSRCLQGDIRLYAIPLTKTEQ